MQTQRSGHGNRKAYNTALVRVFSTPCSRHQGFLFQLTVPRALVVLADSLHLRPFFKPGVFPPPLSACMCVYEVNVACVKPSRKRSASLFQPEALLLPHLRLHVHDRVRDRSDHQP